jgi:phosphoribosylanthranilate isomerase
MESADKTNVIIKVCGITTDLDAAIAVAAGATALGFNFYPQSPRYVSVDQAREIAQGLPPGVLKVGVFVNASLEELTRVRSAVPLDVLQLHGALPDPSPKFRLWRSVAVDKHFNISDLTDSYEAYLLDSPTKAFGGSGRTFNWSLTGNPGGTVRLIVAGGLDESNVVAAIEAVRPWGVDACSRLESQPGRKDPVKVKAFVEAARAAFERLKR